MNLAACQLLAEPPAQALPALLRLISAQLIAIAAEAESSKATLIEPTADQVDQAFAFIDRNDELISRVEAALAASMNATAGNVFAEQPAPALAAVLRSISAQLVAKAAEADPTADQVFALLDRNNDGLVTEEAVREYFKRMADPKQMLQSLSVSTIEEAVQTLLKLLDTNSDSLIRCMHAFVHHVCRVLSYPHIVSYCISPTYCIASNCILPHHLTAPHPTEPSRLHDRDLIALLHPIVAHIMYYHIVSYRILSDLI